MIGLWLIICQNYNFNNFASWSFFLAVFVAYCIFDIREEISALKTFSEYFVQGIFVLWLKIWWVLAIIVLSLLIMFFLGAGHFFSKSDLSSMDGDTVPPNSYKPFLGPWELHCKGKTYKIQRLARFFGTNRQTSCYTSKRIVVFKGIQKIQ